MAHAPNRLPTTAPSSRAAWRRLACAVLSIVPVAASASVWTGAGADNNWGNALNWTGGVPSGFSGFITAQFNNAAAPSTANVNFLVNLTRLEFSAKPWTITGGTISTVAAGATIQVDSNAAINSINVFDDTRFAGTSALSIALFSKTSYSTLTIDGPAVTLGVLYDQSVGPIVVNGGSLNAAPLSGGYALVVGPAGTVTGNNAMWGSLAGSGTVQPSGTFTVGALSADTVFSGTLNATGASVVKTGSGLLQLTGTNTWSNVTVLGGTLQVGNGVSGTLPNAGVTFANGATLTLDTGGAVTIPSFTGYGHLVVKSGTANPVASAWNMEGDTYVLSGAVLNATLNATNGNVIVQSGGAWVPGNSFIGSLSGGGTVGLNGTLSAGYNHADSTFSGTINDMGGQFNKQGIGTLTLSGATLATSNPVTVVGGTLRLQNSATINQQVIVGNATLAGSGTVGGQVTLSASAFFKPEDFHGTSVSTSGAPGAQWVVAIEGTTPGTQYGRAQLSAPPNLTNIGLALTGSYVPQIGDAFTIIDVGAGTLLNGFNNYSNGNVIPFNGRYLRINFFAGTGNDVVLSTATQQVNASVTGNGSISPSGPGQTVLYGSTPSFTLTPAAGHHLDSVTGSCGGSLVGNTFTTNTITTDCDVVANFVVDVPAMQVSTTSLAFGSRRVGTTSVAQAVTVTNTGWGTLSVSASLPSSDFFITSSPSCTLARLAQCTINVVFMPSATGLRTATLTITSNDPSNPADNVSLTGTGVVPVITASPSPLAFGNVNVGANSALPVTVGNSGTGNLVVTGASIAGAADFSVTSNNCGTVVPAGTCTVQVTFTPAAVGARVAILTISSDDPATPIKVVNLTGTGRAPSIFVNPPSITFPDVVVGSATPNQGVFVINGVGPNVIDLSIASVTLTGANAGDFVIASNGCASASLAQGVNCTIQVNFQATAAGARAATLSITSNDPFNPTKTVSLSGTGIGQDTTPDAFSFTNTTNVQPSSVQTSNTVSIAGINSPAPISVTGGEYSIGCLPGGFTAAAGTITIAQTVCVRHTASASYNTTKAPPTVLDVGGVTASFTSTTIARYTLTTAVTGSGGTVTGTGIVCPGDCTEQVDAGTAVTLTAVAGVGSAFAGWSGGGCTGTGQCTVTLDADKTVTATFDPTQYQLTITKLGTGLGIVASTVPLKAIECGETCSATFAHGTVVTLVSSTAVGSRFGSWSGCTVGVAGDCTVTMDGPKTVTATFDLNANPPRLLNISTRGPVLTGDHVMIGGFIISGSAPKQVIVRARGPSLAQFGVPDVLANPQLQLYTGQTPVASNDNWVDAPNKAAIEASGFAPENAQESAILMTLAPGGYTAIVTGVGNTTGIAIVEVFEVGEATTGLLNISTRGPVQTGDHVMIGGFIIQGDGPQTVVIRARGPSLSQFGVPGVLANPQLTIYSGQTPVASNDNWVDAPNKAAIEASTFAPENPNESAILVTLQPGGYTAIVTGVGGGTGIAIVEVFRN